MTEHGWTVIDADAGVLSYTYRFPGGTANAFAARMADGRMFVLSPPSEANDADFDKIQEFGEFGAVAVNNGFHHLGQPAWKKRFPDARFFAAPEVAARIVKRTRAPGPSSRSPS